ncbi:MAG TPA: phosphoribosylglycinamide formyltransferase [Rhodothermales bacterium]
MRLAVLASGGGTNFQAILDAVSRGDLPRVEPVLCLSNKPDAGALERARKFGIRAQVLSSPEDASEMLQALESADAEFVALAGYMRMMPSAVVRSFENRMLNIHPALLPAFGGRGMYGRRVHEAVLQSGARWTGATVHLVDEQYDTGPIVLQEPVPVMPSDTPETLAARVLEAEHRLYPEAVRLFSEDRIRVDGRRVHILDPA